MATSVHSASLVLWWPVVGAGVASLITIGLAAGNDLKWGRNLKDFGEAVSAGPAWSGSDSWATNISVLGGIIGTAAGASGGLQQYLPKGSTGGFVSLTLLFGGAAALAPIVYAAFAKSEGLAEGGGVVSTQGTLAGLCMAAISSLFAALGEIFLGMELARNSSTSTSGEAAFIIPLAIGALIVCIYSFRSIKRLITYSPSDKTLEAGRKATPPSLLSQSNKASATL